MKKDILDLQELEHLNNVILPALNEHSDEARMKLVHEYNTSIMNSEDTKHLVELKAKIDQFDKSHRELLNEYTLTSYKHDRYGRTTIKKLIENKHDNIIRLETTIEDEKIKVVDHVLKYCT